MVIIRRQLLRSRLLGVEIPRKFSVAKWKKKLTENAASLRGKKRSKLDFTTNVRISDGRVHF